MAIRDAFYLCLEISSEVAFVVRRIQDGHAEQQLTDVRLFYQSSFGCANHKVAISMAFLSVLKLWFLFICLLFLYFSGFLSSYNLSGVGREPHGILHRRIGRFAVYGWRLVISSLTRGLGGLMCKPQAQFSLVPQRRRAATRQSHSSSQ